MDPKTGRCAILFPHGVLFRNEEAEMRTKLIEADLLECVLGLGPNLFYNSPMEACVLICRNFKPPERRGKVLFINALNEVAREKAQSFLKPEHQAKILETYQDFADKPGFAFVATTERFWLRTATSPFPSMSRRSPWMAMGKAHRICLPLGRPSKTMALPSGLRWTPSWRC